MKRTAVLLLTAVFAAGLCPGAAAAEENRAATVKYGEYADYHISQPGDISAYGPIYYPEMEWMYDFDSDTLPGGVVCENGTIEVSGKYYLALAEGFISTGRSLKWTTDGAGSTLTFSTEGFRLNNDGFWGNGTLYQYSAAILQEALPQDGSFRAFEYHLNTDCGDFVYSIVLYDEGWNFFTQQIERDDMKANCVVESVVLKQVSGPGGELYLDNVMIATGVGVKGMEEPYVGTVITREEVERKYPTHPLTDEETESFRKLEEAVLPPLAPIEKLSENEMQRYQTFYDSWHVQAVGDKLANGVFPTYYQGTVPGTANSDGYGGTSHPISTRAGTFSSEFGNLGKAYSRVQDPEQKQTLAEYLTGLARLALTYENVPEAWYSGRGFSDGCYYGRAALEETGLLDALYERLKKQYGLDEILYREHNWDTADAGEMKASADDFINNANSNMTILLMAPDGPEKARDFYRFKSFLDNVMYQYSPGTTGTLKPDGTLFHHNVNKYDYGWRDAWNNGMTLYPLWLNDTVFQLAPESLERLALIAEIRYQTVDANGRVGTPDQVNTLSSNGVMRLAQTGAPDGSMKIDPCRAAEWMYFGGKNNSLKNEFLQMGILPAEAPRANVTLSYGPVNIHRLGNQKVQTYASNNLTSFNEYIRPAFLFYNLGGIVLTEEGGHPAIQTDPAQSVNGRHGFALSPGYNVNRAPGVTAPEVDPKLCEQPAYMKGSSPFVGGLSTGNGNGVFTSQFDLNEAVSPGGFQKAGITDFTFKKSYFYFDDLIVCLGSNIGCDADAPLTTGLFQERMSETDQVVTSGGTLGAEEYSNTYRSDDRPWMIDNSGLAGYYLFPGQNYTLSRGEQTFLYQDASEDFDGKGNYVSAYINHDAEDTVLGAEGYSYILVPGADRLKMEQLSGAMQASRPEVEVLRQDEQVHAVRSNALHMTGYVFFDSGAELEHDTVKKVSSPVTLMTKEYEDGKGMSLAVADPNLRILDSADGYSVPKEVSITVKGRWRVKDRADYTAREVSPIDIILTPEGDSVITVTCKDGLTNEYLLENIDDPLADETARIFTFESGSNVVSVNGEEVKLEYGITEKNGTAFIALSDLAGLLQAPLRQKTDENRLEYYYRDSLIIFTPDSRIATIDGEVVLLEQEVCSENGTYFVPLSVLEDIFRTGSEASGTLLSYTESHAPWVNWDYVRPAPEGFVFTGGQGGSEPQTGVNTLTLPEGLNEGVFVLAVYQDGILKDTRISDLSAPEAVRVLQYRIDESDDAAEYTVKGFLFDSLDNLRPLLSPCLIYEK